MQAELTQKNVKLERLLNTHGVILRVLAFRGAAGSILDQSSQMPEFTWLLQLGTKNTTA